MKNNRGFNLISLLVSLVLGGIIIMGISTMYTDLVHSKLYGSNKQLLTLHYGTAVNQLATNIKQSGTFGCYSSRILGNMGYGVANTLPIGSGILQYESTVAGLFAFTSSNIPNLDSSVFTGIALATNSDILKLQYGSGQAIITGVTSSGTPSIINVINFVQPRYTHVSGNIISADSPTIYRQAISLSSSSNAPYVIASCNRLDQVQGNLNTSTNTITVLSYAIPLAVNKSHDTSSWQLMNLITRYYYVATIGGITGLYMQSTQSDGSLGVSTLIDQGVTQMGYTFEVENISGRQMKSTLNMASTDWINIDEVIFNMNIQTIESVSMTNTPVVQNIQQSVMVRQ